MRNKAWRRKQEFRKKNKVVKKYFNWWGDEDWDPKSIGLRSHTPCLCSCWMCGNPRKYYNDGTIQEKKNERMHELLESLQEKE
jgi:hypothetical protein